MADNRSIFEQMSGTLGSQYSQTLGLLARSNKKKDKKAKRRALLGSILFSGLSESSKYLKNSLEEKIADLTRKGTWDENYVKEIWTQGAQIKATQAALDQNPSYFYKIAADDLVNSSPYRDAIAKAGGVNNLNPEAYKTYTSLVKAREGELLENHKTRMNNPTAGYSTFKEFSQPDRDMLTYQANNLKNDLSNRNIFFAALKKLGVGKDKEIEFNAELQNMMTDQEERYKAAEAYIAPLDVTRFVNYDIDGNALFVSNSSLDLTKSDDTKTRIRKTMTDEDNATFANLSFNDTTGPYELNNVPLLNLQDSGTKRTDGKPFDPDTLTKWELYMEAGVDELGNPIYVQDKNNVRGPVPYLVDDLYLLERTIEANQQAELRNGTRSTIDSEEIRYAMAAQQLVNNGNIRYDTAGWDNYVYIPLNKNVQSNNNDNNDSTKLDILATVYNQTELDNGQDFETIYSQYIADKTNDADISGNIEELQFLESIKGEENQASEEARLIFMINPPKELRGKILTFGTGDKKQGVTIGSPNENYNYYYELYKNGTNPETGVKNNYGSSQAIETLLELHSNNKLYSTDSTGTKSSFETDINISDRPIINKIIEVESSGNPDAVSDHGAKGYMQLLDSTADNPGLGVKPAVRNADGSISPEENVRVGTDYFDALTEKYNGDLVTAAMAYNAGMGTIDEWIEDGKDFSKLRSETQDYVKKIFGEEIYNELKNAGVSTVSNSISNSVIVSSDSTAGKSLLSRDEEGDIVVRPGQAVDATVEGILATTEGIQNFRNKNLVKNLEKNLENIKNNRSAIGITMNQRFRNYITENYNDMSFASLSKENKIKAIEEYIKILKS